MNAELKIGKSELKDAVYAHIAEDLTTMAEREILRHGDTIMRVTAAETGLTVDSMLDHGGYLKFGVRL